MTNEEREIITRFIERAAGSGGGGSVPSTGAPLPPVDPEADALIGELFAQHPEARYRITQMAFVQEHALAESQNRIGQLQYQLAMARQAPPPMPAAGRGGFLSGLFGGGGSAPPPPWNAAPAAPPPPPAYAPGYQPGMFQRGGSGFLGSALSTAAGVAGGLVAGNALMNLFSPHAGLGGGNFAGPENVTVINEAPSPWTDPSGGASGSAAAAAPAADPWGNSQPGGGFDPTQAGFDPNQGNFDPNQGNFDPNQGGFDPTQAGFDPNQGGLDPTQGGFDPNQGGFDSGGFGGTDDTTQV